jgi:hypothetical protein
LYVTTGSYCQMHNGKLLMNFNRIARMLAGLFQNMKGYITRTTIIHSSHLIFPNNLLLENFSNSANTLTLNL